MSFKTKSFAKIQRFRRIEIENIHVTGIPRSKHKKCRVFDELALVIQSSWRFCHRGKSMHIEHPFGTTMASGRNRVMRNTHLLLALSMLPTALGAFLGVGLGLGALFSGFLGALLFLGVAFAFMWAIEKNKDSAAGVPILLAFTFFMGIVLSNILRHTLKFSNGPELITVAFLGTAGVFAAMAGLATVIKSDVSSMGRWLFMGVIVLLVGSLVNILIGSTVLMLVLSTLSIGIFSAYLLFDMKRIIDGGETNYITATLSIYLSLFNIFQSLLSILGVLGGERD
jgi:modulator of FtsH protease